MKTGKTYDGTVLLADTGGKYVNYRVEQRGKTKNSKHRECSHTPGKIPDPAHLPGRGFSLWGSPNPLFLSMFTIIMFQKSACAGIIKET